MKNRNYPYPKIMRYHFNVISQLAKILAGFVLATLLFSFPYGILQAATVDFQPDNAPPATESFLSKSIDSASFIFHGKVVSVTYKSAITTTHVKYPLTYITFQIIETLYGSYGSKEIVLMLPGAGFLPNGNFALSEHLPILAEDDEIVIFLKGGSMNGPQYISHLFVIDSMLYDDESRLLVMGDDGHITRGVFVHQDKILNRPINKVISLGRSHSGQVSSLQQISDITVHNPLYIDQFGSYVRGRSLQESIRTLPADERSVRSNLQLEPIESADVTRKLIHVPRQGLQREK